MNIVIRGIRYICGRLSGQIQLRKAQLEWLLENRHNKTRMGNYFPNNCVKVGRYTYGKLIVHHFAVDGEGLEIGDFCSIGPDVEFFLGGEHHPKYLFNYPFGLYIGAMGKYESYDRTSKGKIIVEDDVWIGAHALIMSGVCIGRGAIIGAGAIVARDVPPYAIYAGGRILKYRFSEKIVEKLVQADFSKIDKEFLRKHGDMFYTENIESVLKDLPMESNI